ncbi:MAG: ThiF family adenylyltransferase [Dehalococcoidia bacterium]|nr:ThiF family adenylyltransferase [Dehalococcoidia bacterium]
MRVARRNLDGLPFYRLLRDWSWHDTVQSWAIQFSITLPDPVTESSIPQTTLWWLRASDSFPRGPIEILPDSVAGIRGTYPHQALNLDIDAPWRTGRICLSDRWTNDARYRDQLEPRDAESRLVWHVYRAHAWISAARDGSLQAEGEPFELPPMLETGALPKDYRRIAFAEGLDAGNWLAGLTSGRCELVPVNDSTLALTRFGDHRGRKIPSHQWGTLLSKRASVVSGIWLLLPGYPVVEPWSAPQTWGELRAAMRRFGLDLDAALKRLLPGLRNGRKTFVMLGCPIPERYGEPVRKLHWLAAALLPLSRAHVDGFRDGEIGWWHADRHGQFRNEAPIFWVETVDWHPDALRGRGSVAEYWRKARVGMLGAGALGSAFAELLIRGGVRHLTVYDSEALMGGNLVRHTGTMASVGANKSEGLAAHLNQASPHAQVTAFPVSIPFLEPEPLEALRQTDIVVDCTGDDDVIDQLAATDWGEPRERLLISVSMGFKAHRAFLFLSRGSAFDGETFHRLMSPWREREWQEIEAADLPRDALGCWHPLLPAAAHDVWSVAAALVQFLETQGVEESASRFIVLERRADGLGFDIAQDTKGQ